MREQLYTTPALAAALGPQAHLAAALRFEAALARAEARAGVIPAAAAEAIAAACDPARYDVESLYARALTAGTLAIPLVQAITAQTAEAGRGYVHWGATSQDAIDSALMLQLRDGLDLILADLAGLAGACAALAVAHRDTLMLGRTLLQQALPMPFGLKVARWLAMLTRQIQTLRAARAGLALQFGGAAGTLAALGERGLAVAELLAAELDLALPELPWHAERDRVAGLAGDLGVLAGACAKIARDLLLLAQSEVGEAGPADEPGKGGSSAMPQKRNPVDATFALAAARLAIGQVPIVLAAMDQEHERAAGGWQAEWQALPELCMFAGGALARLADAVTGLQVDPARMRANLEQSGGLALAESLTLALARHLGRPEAQRLVTAACGRAVAASQTLPEVALADQAIVSALGPQAVAAALDPASYLGSAEQLIDRALEAYQNTIADSR